jgi:hypothetical protein
MKLTLPRNDRFPQVQITVTHPEWVTTSTLDDSHLTMELAVPEGCDINDVEVSAQFLDVHGQPDADSPPTILKEKAHAAKTNDAGKSDEPHSDESIGDRQHPEDSNPTDAGVQGDADAGRVGEAEVEQDTSSEPATDEAKALGVDAHHKSRRPKHG